MSLNILHAIHDDNPVKDREHTGIYMHRKGYQGDYQGNSGQLGTMKDAVVRTSTGKDVTL